MKYCITMDTDWASDEEVNALHGFLISNDVVPTVFATNAGAAEDIAKLYPNDVGLHPNFAPDSTHGSTRDEVWTKLKGIFPNAKCFRSHSFQDSSKILSNLTWYGMEYDSNLCTDMQKGIVPIKMAASRRWRYPVFWEDDVHHNPSPHNFEPFKTPGLKIINVHPKLFPNTKEFLQGLIDMVHGMGDKFYTLHKIHLNHTKPTLKDKIWANLTNLSLKEHYDRINPVGPQATCRDIYAKELECDMILPNVKPGLILDLGCGNGDTLRRIDSPTKTGIDFSQNMIDEARRTDPTSIYSRDDVFNYLAMDLMPYSTIITERLMINLKSRAAQYDLAKLIHNRLEPDGVFLMCEGSLQGFNKLNVLRVAVGLPEIRENADENTGIRIDETILEPMIESIGFSLEKKLGISDYMMISRVNYPFMVGHDKVQFDSEYNRMAMEIQRTRPYTPGIGNNTLWVWRKLTK